MMDNSGGRKQGVRGNAPVKKDGFQPRSLLGMQLGQVALVTYADENGVAHENMVFFFNGKPYMDGRGGEQWLRERLSPVSPWLSQQLESAYAREHAEPSSEDQEPEIPAMSVDVAPPPPEMPAPPPAGKRAGTKEQLVSTLTKGRA